METELVKQIRFADGIVALCAWPGKLAAWLSLGIIGLSFISILSGLFRFHSYFSWADPIFLFGTELNSTSIQELQWHLFAVMMLFAGSYTYALDGHVRVDVFYSKFSDKGKIIVNLLGDWLFLLPFAVCILVYSLDLVKFAYMTKEASSAMGLTHRYVVKALLPLAMALLCVQATARGAGGLLRLVALGHGIDPRTLRPREGGDA